MWHKSTSNGTCTDGSAAFVRHSDWKDEDKTKALKERFELASRRNRYKAEFQTCRKKKAEPLANITKDVKVMLDKVCKNMPDNRWNLQFFAHRWRINKWFCVRKMRAVTLDIAVNSTLEKESY